MKLSLLALVLAFATAPPLVAQAPGPPGPPPDVKTAIRVRTGMDGVGGGMEGGLTIRHEMGEWWKNSEIAKKLQLTDAQVSKLNQIFYDHRLKLIDYRAAMEKEDLRLQNLLDQDSPDEKQVSAQVDGTLAARSNLEREFTMMNLDLRRVLSVAQWRQLKSMQEQRGPADRIFLYRKMGPNSFYKRMGPDSRPDVGPDSIPVPPAPDPADPEGDGMF